MEKRLKFLEKNSVLTNSIVLRDEHFSSGTSATHPSTSTMSQHFEMLLAKINSGDKLLSKIPKRIDPSVVFSDDEDDENVVDKENKGGEKNPKETVNHFQKYQDFARPSTIGPSKTFNLFQRAKLSPCEVKHEKLQSAEKRKLSESPKNLHSDLHASKTPTLTIELLNKSTTPLTIKSMITKSSELKSLKSQASNFTLKKIMENENILPPLSDQATTVSEKSPTPSTVKSVITKSTESKSSKPEASNFTSKKFMQNENSRSPLSDQTITVNEKAYTVLDVLGSGGSCKVYSVFDVKEKVLVAIKVVDFKNVDQSVIDGYKKEIEYLQKLQESNRVIKMFDYEYQASKLFLVLERGEIDLAKFISNEAKLKQLSPIMIKFYWSQMLEAVADIHQYGIIHSDLKPANFLLVSGHLKLIDFGIATSVQSDMTSTFRDTQVGTLNYMSPEAIICHSQTDNKQALFKVGVKSDVWSLGCILYNLVYGTTPFYSIRNMYQKIQAITDPKYEITFAPIKDKLLLDVIKSCLKKDPKERASIRELQQHSYLNTDKPCTPRGGNPTSRKDLKNVMQQMESLTPRRINYLSNILQKLSTKPNS